MEKHIIILVIFVFLRYCCDKMHTVWLVRTNELPYEGNPVACDVNQSFTLKLIKPSTKHHTVDLVHNIHSIVLGLNCAWKRHKLRIEFLRKNCQDITHSKVTFIFHIGNLPLNAHKYFSTAFFNPIVRLQLSIRQFLSSK